MKNWAIFLITSGAVCAPVLGQSSSTLFGAIDVGLSHYRLSSSAANAGPLAAGVRLSRSETGLYSNGSTPSRIGMRGSETLSADLSVSYWLEAGLANIGTGAGYGPGGSLNFNRRSTISMVSKHWGELRLGRDNTATYWNDALFSPFGTLGVGTNLISTVGSNLQLVRGPGSTTAANDNYMRTNNAIGYVLPSNAAGWYGQFQYAKQPTSQPSRQGRYIGLRLGKKWGAWDMAIAAGESIAAAAKPLVNSSGVATGVTLNEKISTLSLGIAYSVGATRFSGQVAQISDQRDFQGSMTGAQRQTDRYRGALLGLSTPLGPQGTVKVAYSIVDLDAADSADAKVQRLAVGYEYALSKRTAVYTTAAKTLISHGANSPRIIGVRPGGTAAFPALDQGAGPRSSMGYEFGIRHSF